VFLLFDLLRLDCGRDAGGRSDVEVSRVMWEGREVESFERERAGGEDVEVCFLERCSEGGAMPPSLQPVYEDGFESPLVR